MNRIDPEKRNQLIGLTLGTAVFVVLVWYLLILPLQAGLVSKEQKLGEAREAVQKVRGNIKLLDRFEEDLQVSRGRLQREEERMASGDVYRWILRTFDELEALHRISIFNLEAPRIEEWRTPPAVPYKAAIFTVSGTAYYHDFGKFLAALENQFPYLRLSELELRPARFVDTGSKDREKLTFKMELLTLVKPIPQPQ